MYKLIFDKLIKPTNIIILSRTIIYLFFVYPSYLNMLFMSTSISISRWVIIYERHSYIENNIYHQICSYYLILCTSTRYCYRLSTSFVSINLSLLNNYCCYFIFVYNTLTLIFYFVVISYFLYFLFYIYSFWSSNSNCFCSLSFVFIVCLVWKILSDNLFTPTNRLLIYYFYLIMFYSSIVS